MKKDIEEVKATIGEKKFNEIEAFARKLKKEGKTPGEVKAAIKAAYSEPIGRGIPTNLVAVIT